jgi:hypothetical protein
VLKGDANFQHTFFCAPKRQGAAERGVVAPHRLPGEKGVHERVGNAPRRLPLVLQPADPTTIEPPWLRFPGHGSLEVELERKLQLPRRSSRAQNLTYERARQNCDGQSEVRMIENIKSLCPEFDVHVFSDRSYFAQR